MGYALKRNQTTRPLLFLMVAASDHLTGKTGLSPTVTLSKNGAAFGTPHGAVTELANGWYKVAADATDCDTLGPLLLHATAATADPTDDRFEVVAFDPESAASLGLSNLDGTVTSRAAAADYTATRAGKLDYLDAAVSSRLAAGGYTAPPSSAAIADAVLDEALADHAVAGSLGQALGSVEGRLPAALVGGRIDANVGAIHNVALAAVRLALSAGQMIPGTVDTTVNGHTPTTSQFQADDITEATAEHYKGRLVLFTSGSLAGQVAEILAYQRVGGIGQFTVSTMTDSPANDDTLLII